MRFILCFLLCPLFVSSQSLSPERVAKIKSCTVKVLAGEKMGTGFYVDNKGTVATCWHVVFESLKANTPIYTLTTGGKELLMSVPENLILESLYLNAVSYDYFVLTPAKPLTQPTPFLKLGNYAALNEGQEVYTCGYPLNSEFQFVSKGIVSTKYLQKKNYLQVGMVKTIKPRKESILDLTLNQGNSGGAIIKIGKTINDDEVVGIADFVINPLGNTADSMINSAKMSQGAISMGTIDDTGKMFGVDPSATVVIFGQAIKAMSIGISGCISVEYLLEGLKSLLLLK